MVISISYQIYAHDKEGEDWFPSILIFLAHPLQRIISGVVSPKGKSEGPHLTLFLTNLGHMTEWKHSRKSQKIKESEVKQQRERSKKWGIGLDSGLLYSLPININQLLLLLYYIALLFELLCEIFFEGRRIGFQLKNLSDKSSSSMQNLQSTKWI